MPEDEFYHKTMGYGTEVSKYLRLKKGSFTLSNFKYAPFILNRPGVAGAVLQSPPSLID